MGMGATQRSRIIARAMGKVTAARAMISKEARSTGDPAIPLLADALADVLALLDDSDPAIAKSLARAQDLGREASKGDKP